MNGFSTASLGISLGSLIGILIVALLIGVFVIVVFANRADQDAAGRRPMAAYLFTAAFFTLWIAFSGAVAIVVSLVSLIGHTTVFFGFGEIHPVGDAAVRGVTLGALLLIVAGAAHMLHRRRGLALAESEDDVSSATRRTARSYVAAVSFVTILIMIGDLIYTVYTICGLIAPGVYQAAGRTSTWKTLIIELCVLAFAALAFIRDQRLAPGSLRLISMSRPMVSAAPMDVVESVDPPSPAQ
jgi:hypothetical protein